MKKLFTSALLLGGLCLANLASAADRTVGPGGTYGSIGDAIAAAADGDRILVKPKAVPYGETLNITKSLTILSADEGTYFDCVGTWTYTPATAGKKLTIIGLRLLSGDIQNGGSAPGGARARLELLNSVIKGDLNFHAPQYDLTVAADSIFGHVHFAFGKVIGNYIDGFAEGEVIYVTTDPVTTTDSVWVVGNKVRGNNTNSHSVLNLSTSSQYIYCVNNFLLLNYANVNNYGVYFNAQRAGVGVNTFANNSIYDAGNQNWCCSRYALYINSPLTNTQIVANLISSAANGNGAAALVQSGGVNNYTLAYNFLRGFTMSVSVPNNGTNKTNSTATINATTGQATGDAINGGPTDAEYTDINLSRGDVGAWGGSFTLENFHPFVSTTALNNRGGRVFLLRAPRRVLQGGSIQVKAEGFDR